MKIETKKSQGFKTAIIGLFESDPASIADFRSIAAKWASELIEETIASAIKMKRLLPKKEIEIAVSVSIGEPTKEDDEG